LTSSLLLFLLPLFSHLLSAMAKVSNEPKMIIARCS